MAGAEEGVRRAAEPQPRRLGLRDERLGGGQVRRDRLLVEDVLAGGEGRRSDLGMRGGHREVDDQLDVVAGERLLECPVGGDAMALGLRPRGLGPQVGDDAHVEVGVAGHVGQVLLADLARAHDADADRPRAAHRTPRPFANARPAASPSKRSPA
jgi:hypothetical protein